MTLKYFDLKILFQLFKYIEESQMTLLIRAVILQVKERQERGCSNTYKNEVVYRKSLIVHEPGTWCKPALQHSHIVPRLPTPALRPALITTHGKIKPLTRTHTLEDTRSKWFYLSNINDLFYISSNSFILFKQTKTHITVMFHPRWECVTLKMMKPCFDWIRLPASFIHEIRMGSAQRSASKQPECQQPEKRTLSQTFLQGTVITLPD